MGKTFKNVLSHFVSTCLGKGQRQQLVIFNSLLHFELILLYGVRQKSTLSLSM